jgi:hypothetical protein
MAIDQRQSIWQQVGVLPALTVVAGLFADLDLAAITDTRSDVERTFIDGAIGALQSELVAQLTRGRTIFSNVGLVRCIKEIVEVRWEPGGAISPGYPTPVEIINHCVWLYFSFPLMEEPLMPPSVPRKAEAVSSVARWPDGIEQFVQTGRVTAVYVRINPIGNFGYKRERHRQTSLDDHLEQRVDGRVRIAWTDGDVQFGAIAVGKDGTDDLGQFPR